MTEKEEFENRAGDAVNACVAGTYGVFEQNGFPVAGCMLMVVTGTVAVGAVAYHSEAYPTDAEFLDRVEAWIAERRRDIAGSKGRLN
jgi:hypothetical protein